MPGIGAERVRELPEVQKHETLSGLPRRERVVTGRIGLATAAQALSRPGKEQAEKPEKQRAAIRHEVSFVDQRRGRVKLRYTAR